MQGVGPFLRTSALVAAIAAAAPASAVDLSVSSIEVTQGVQNAAGTTPLVARNATMVRVRISLNGQTTSQPDVDAVLRIYANGVEIPSSPVYSLNGPISAPASPSSAQINHTINFLCLPPQSADVDFVVTVNPFRTVEETNYDNNLLALNNRSFLCRKFVDLAYVPINYTAGAGLPSASMIEPGNGDAFLRGIYKTGDWNYHRSPLPSFVWASNVETSDDALLVALNDVRQNQIPAAGYARPEFIYGWLPGNPFSGNGKAIGIPGAAAFGNTENARFQRTFAHEIGHCWGLVHNSSSIGTVGIDVEHLLRDPMNVAQLMPTTKKDVMYAGLTTVEAWAVSATYLDAINDARSACSAADGDGGDGDGGGGESDADAAPVGSDVLRVAGVHDHVRRRVTLLPMREHARLEPTVDDPDGNVVVESYADGGALLASVRVDTRGCRESCAARGHLHATTPLYVNLPRTVDGRAAVRVVVRETARGGVEGRPLAEARRSAHAPVVERFVLERADRDAEPMQGPDGVSSRLLGGISSGIREEAPPAGQGPDAEDSRVDVGAVDGSVGRAPVVGRVRLAWDARDEDGDVLSADLLYSPDGGEAWIPLAVDERTGAFEFESSDVPASRGPSARFRIRVGDGFGIAEQEFPLATAFGGGSPPDVHVIAPNNATSVRQGATVLLHGSGWDLDDQLLPDASLAWSSSIAGALGTGRFLPVRNLAPGAHVITLVGTDSDGMTSQREIALTVVARDYNTCDLDGDGTVGAADVAGLLASWGGNGLADVTLDGVVDSADLAVFLARWGS